MWSRRNEDRPHRSGGNAKARRVNRKNILVLGTSGMLGNAVFRQLSDDGRYAVTGTLRSADARRHFPNAGPADLLANIDAAHDSDLIAAFTAAKPDVVINCIGVIKQTAAASDPLPTLTINALLPHRIARLCAMTGARLIHISTDCVFSGTRGNYREEDFADASDLYGRSKYLGEVDHPHAITLRTSIIGHELGSRHGLVDWFLGQSGTVKGYRQAIFSGLPTVEVADVIADFVIPNPGLSGVLHLSAAPINKYDLLSLVADVYEKTVDLQADDAISIDRSLDSSKFRAATGYQPATWPELVRKMHRSRNAWKQQSGAGSD